MQDMELYEKNSTRFVRISSNIIYLKEDNYV